MSDPQPDRLKPKPKRAEPLQPDNPGSGDEQESSTSAASDNDQKPSDQASNALENVRNGYD